MPAQFCLVGNEFMTNESIKREIEYPEAIHRDALIVAVARSSGAGILGTAEATKTGR